MHKFKKGDQVTIFNQSFSGQFVIEGQAVILKPIRDVDEQYRVRFIGLDGKPSLGEDYDRFVDPAGQDSPQEYLKLLNHPTPIMAG